MLEMKELRNLRQYVTTIQSQVACSMEGFPLLLVNPNAIQATGMLAAPEVLIDEPTKDQYFVIEYIEQYIPTVEGYPVWEKLECEPVDYYNWFKAYREMQDDKNRRAIYKLSDKLGVKATQLEHVRNIWHWTYRVQCYDLFREAERERTREIARINMEGKHHKAAAKLFELSTNYLKEHEDLLTPGMALKMLDTAVKLERLSLGMNAKEQEDATPTARIEVSANATTTVSDDTAENKERLTQLLNIMNNIGVLRPEGEVIDVEPSELESTSTT